MRALALPVVQRDAVADRAFQRDVGTLPINTLDAGHPCPRGLHNYEQPLRPQLGGVRFCAQALEGDAKRRVSRFVPGGYVKLEHLAELLNGSVREVGRRGGGRHSESVVGDVANG